MENDRHPAAVSSPPPSAQSAESRAAASIRAVFQSGRPVVYIRTVEEQRVAALLREIARDLFQSPVPVWTWTLTEGLRRDGASAELGTESPRAALDFIVTHEGAGIFHMADFHESLRESAEVRRRLRDVYASCLDRRKFVVVTSPVRFLPEEIERVVVYFELRQPDRTEMAALLRQEAAARNPDAALDPQLTDRLSVALLGLTLDEARYALRRVRSAGVALGPEAIPILLEEKRLLVNRSGVIEYIPEQGSLDEIGGLDVLKKWLLERREIFRDRDSVSEEIVPKGLLMMGIPGCGKSLSVKAIAAAFELPLYRIDMPAIFSGRFGKAEGAFVEACRMMEDMAPAVLWFDEIEMGINSADSGGEQGRLFAFFLTWMQEKTRGLFVAATANRIDLLPAEMIRKGRFDEVFFVDLPLPAERIEIFRIHLARRAVDLAAFDLAKLTEFTNGWAGAEIEQCVVSAMTKAHLAGRQLTEEDLIRVAVKIVPLSRTMNEQINHIRGWAFERAVRASATEH